MESKTTKKMINLTPWNNGGESLYLELTAHEGRYITEKLILMSYGSNVELNTIGSFSSKNLMRIMEELQTFEITSLTNKED
jgi:hypothetical protein